MQRYITTRFHRFLQDLEGATRAINGQSIYRRIVWCGIMRGNSKRTEIQALLLAQLLFLLMFGLLGLFRFPATSTGDVFYEYSLGDDDIAHLNVTTIETTLADYGYEAEMTQYSRGFFSCKILSSFEPKQVIFLEGNASWVWFHGDITSEYSIILFDPRVTYDGPKVKDMLKEELKDISLALNLSGTFEGENWGDKNFGPFSIMAIPAWCCGVLIFPSGLILLIKAFEPAEADLDLPLPWETFQQPPQPPPDNHKDTKKNS